MADFLKTRTDLQQRDRKSTRLNSSHVKISYAVFCLKQKKRGSTVGLASMYRALNSLVEQSLFHHASLERAIAAIEQETGYYVVLLDVVFFFFNDTATTEIYTLSLHDVFR